MAVHLILWIVMGMAVTEKLYGEVVANDVEDEKKS